MRLVMYTQSLEDGRATGGSDWLVAELTQREVFAMANQPEGLHAGLRLLVGGAAALLPKDDSWTEYMLDFELLGDGQLTEMERFQKEQNDPYSMSPKCIFEWAHNNEKWAKENPEG